ALFLCVVRPTSSPRPSWIEWRPFPDITFGNRGRSHVTYNRAHRRGVRAVLVLAALTAAALLAPTGASALSEQADTGIWGAHGRVLAMVRLGNTMFIGGRFDRVQSPDGNTRIAADNLAAIDLT